MYDNQLPRYHIDPMNEDAMKARTKAFALRVIKVTESLPATRAADVIGKQLLRSATSVGANYRASRRARSRADFVNKLGIVEEEADESAYWLELLVESGVVPQDKLVELMRECDEITAIIVASTRTAKARRDCATSAIRHPTFVEVSAAPPPACAALEHPRASPGCSNLRRCRASGSRIRRRRLASSAAGPAWRRAGAGTRQAGL
jgi:four helix bundle protein